MSRPSEREPSNTTERKRSRKDWILLPAIGLLTLYVMASASETAARHMFSETSGGINACVNATDVKTGARFIPNTVCWEKTFETSLVRYRFNNCGNRSDTDCVPKQPGTFRIVVVGSSYAWGCRVDYDKSFAFLLPKKLTQISGRKVEVYDEAVAFGYPRMTAAQFDRALKSQPDLILWALTPMDIEDVSNNSAEKAALRANNTKLLQSAVHESLASGSVTGFFSHLFQMVQARFETYRTPMVLQHFLYENESQEKFVQSYIQRGDRSAGFLNANLSSDWQEKLHQFQGYDADMETRAKAAGVPLVVVLLPNRAQAALLATKTPPPGIDPYKLGNALREIVQQDGGTYLDVPSGFRNITAPERFYYPVDGHADAEGHRVFTDILAKDLTSGAVPAFRISGNSADQRQSE